jgi:S-(hydroxymethyl)glutathione dehydrogenase / alcohol dehydrogenase
VKAAVCRAFGAPLEIEDLVLDAPQEGEVRVRIAACAICHSDVALVDGAWGGDLPAVYGHEAAGIVEEVGQDAHGVTPGDRVVVSLLRSCGRCFFCARGEAHLCEHEFPSDRRTMLRTSDGEPIAHGLHTAAFAEEVVVDQSQVAVVPGSLALEVAALLGCGVVTGFGAVVNRADVRRGESVLVVGAGGVGLNSVQGAALRGAAPIIASEISPAKRATAIELGATHAVDPGAGDLAGEVRALTEGRGVDYAFVTVGRGDVVEETLACVRRGGTLVVVGMPPSGDTFRVETVDLAHNDVRILGSKVGSAARLSTAVPPLVELYEQGRLKLDELISERYPLERIEDAMASAREGKGLRNVLVLDAE